MADILRPETLSGPIERMLADNVLLRLLPRSEQEGYTGKLVLPEVRNKAKAEQQDRQTMWCSVVQCGPKAPDIKPGDRVLVTLLAGDRIWIAGYEHRVVRYDEILCVEEEEEKEEEEETTIVEADVCGKECSDGSPCLLLRGHDPVGGHETQHGCTFFELEVVKKGLGQ